MPSVADDKNVYIVNSIDQDVNDNDYKENLKNMKNTLQQINVLLRFSNYT